MAGGIYEVNERGTPELLKFGGRQMLLMPTNGNGYVTPMAEVSRQSGLSQTDPRIITLLEKIASKQELTVSDLSRSIRDEVLQVVK